MECVESWNAECMECGMCVEGVDMACGAWRGECVEWVECGAYGRNVCRTVWMNSVAERVAGPRGNA